MDIASWLFSGFSLGEKTACEKTLQPLCLFLEEEKLAFR